MDRNLKCGIRNLKYHYRENGNKCLNSVKKN